MPTAMPSRVPKPREATPTLRSASACSAVGFGSDINGFAGMPAPRFGPYACDGDGDRQPEITKVARVRAYLDENETFEKLQAGYRVFDINYDGFANIGLFPDFVQELQSVGVSRQELEPLFRGAEAYIQTWQAADDLATTRLPPPDDDQQYANKCEELLRRAP
jgi:hypothetical protein